MVQTKTPLRHILSADQLDEDFLLDLFRNADQMRELFETPGGPAQLRMLLDGKLMKYIFFEPSTRTRMSFEDGASLLGMTVSGTDLADKFSSFAKHGEIEPEFRTMSGYKSDIIIVRAKNAGDVASASRFSRSPVVNAGDGSAEHPTQAILDLYTIWREYGRLNNLTIGLGGDLLYGRTVHSLVNVLSRFEGNKFILVSPAGMELPDKYKAHIENNNCEYQELHDVQEAMPLADFWYWTRVQFERVRVPTGLRFWQISSELDLADEDGFAQLKAEDQEKQRQAVLQYEKELFFEIAKTFGIGVRELELMKKDAILLHPQPIDKRVREIRKNVVWQGMLPIEEREEIFKKVRIFEQSDNGLWVRMALIFWVVTGTHTTMLGPF